MIGKTESGGSLSLFCNAKRAKGDGNVLTGSQMISYTFLMWKVICAENGEKSGKDPYSASLNT